MPTESITLADSQNATHNGGYGGTRVREKLADTTQVGLAEGVSDALVAAGWTQEGGTKASFSLVLSNGVPWVHSIPDPPIDPKPTVDRGIQICSMGGDQFHFYDPYRSSPNVALDYITWIQMGLSEAASRGNLQTKIVNLGWSHLGSWQQETAPYTNWWHMDFEAPAIGFAWNGLNIGGEKQVEGSANAVGFFGFIWMVGSLGPGNDACSGGGLILRSTQDAGWLDVGIRPNERWPCYPTFRFTASTGGSNPTYTLNTGMGSYTIIANQFQFFVFRETDPLSLAGTQVLMATFPMLATDHGVTYGAVLASGRSFRIRTEWAHVNAPCSAAANSGLTRRLGDYDEYPGSSPLLYPIKYRHTLLMPNGAPVAEPCFIGAPINDAPKTIAGQARIIGQMWDALLIHDHFPVDVRALFGNLKMQCVGNEYSYWASKVSLWVAYGTK